MVFTVLLFILDLFHYYQICGKRYRAISERPRVKSGMTRGLWGWCEQLLLAEWIASEAEKYDADRVWYYWLWMTSAKSAPWEDNLRVIQLYSCCFRRHPLDWKRETSHRANNDFKIFKVRPSPHTYSGTPLTILYITLCLSFTRLV